MPSFGKENKTQSMQPNNNQVLSIEFLEYLADMSDVNGQLIGPQDLAQLDCNERDIQMNHSENEELKHGQEPKPKHKEHKGPPSECANAEVPKQ